MNALPEVARAGMLDMQVCVPKDWTNEQVLEFAESKNPCGTTHGWVIREQDSALLNGDPERVDCLDKSGHVHIMLDA